MQQRRAGRPSTIPPNPRMANRLRELRERAGLSQESFAEFAGIGQQQLSKIENWRAPISNEQAREWAPRLNCSPLDFFLENEGGLTIPVTLAAAAASAPNAPASYDLPAPHRRIAALPMIADVDDCDGVEVLDDHADRLPYPPRSTVVRRPLRKRRGKLRLGQKIVVRRMKRLEGGTRRTHEVLIGKLGIADGDLVLQLRSTNPELPAALTIQRHRLPAGLDEPALRAIPNGDAIDYVAHDDDPAEIVGTVVMAITPEED